MQNTAYKKEDEEKEHVVPIEHNEYIINSELDDCDNFRSRDLIDVLREYQMAGFENTTMTEVIQLLIYINEKRAEK